MHAVRLLPYTVVLVSDAPHYESAESIQTPSPSGAYLPAHPPHPSRSSQSTGRSFLCYKATSTKDLFYMWYLTCLLRNLYAGQEATAQTGHGTTDWFQIGKGVRQDCILSPCLFNFYAEYIMRNAGLEETQAGIKIAGRNINNLRYADDTTLMAESEEELKSLLMKVKVESERVGLKLNFQKTKIMASSPITSWEIDGETVETVSDYFSGLQNHCRW